MSTTRVGDLTAKARIRDAAIHCVAEHGVASTTVRKIAAAARVSPGLVIHHFGSMEGLRSTCDEYVAARIREIKEEAASAGPGIDLLAAIREADFAPLAGYLATVLVEDSPAVAKLVDNLVADAEDYSQKFVEAGMMRPSTDPRGRAAVLVLWLLGALVMHKHLQRILGVDLSDPQISQDPAAIASYTIPVYEVLSEGIFTEAFAEHARDSFADFANEDIAQEE